ATIKRRARELRALGESKAAAFRQSQLGRTLRVLTLRPGDDLDSSTTPALSSNYLRFRIGGTFSANLWLDIQVTGEVETFSTGPVFSFGQGRHAAITRSPEMVHPLRPRSLASSFGTAPVLFA